ncbi:MAG TPA: addiction module protein [Thermoanaerobaculia bacterium]
MTVDELEVEVLKLSLESRAELAHRILLSLDEAEEPDPEHERLWMEEIERRYRAVREGTARLTPADEVLAAIRAELR